MKTKIKMKTRIILLSSIIMCLFILNSSLSAQAADPPTMTLLFDETFNAETLPITIDVLMHWDNIGSNWQTIVSIYVYYVINKHTIDEKTSVSYVKEELSTDPRRPTMMTFAIPQAGLTANDAVRFRVDFTWKPLVGKEQTIISEVSVIKGELRPDVELGLYAIIGICAGAAVLVILLGLYWFKRRRN